MCVLILVFFVCCADLMQDLQMDELFAWKQTFTDLKTPLPILMALDMVCPEIKDKIMHDIELVLEKELQKISVKKQNELKEIGNIFYLNQLENPSNYSLRFPSNEKVRQILRSDCECCKCLDDEDYICPSSFGQLGCSCVCEYRLDIVEKSQDVHIWHSGDPDKQHIRAHKNYLKTGDRETLFLWLHHVLETAGNRKEHLVLTTDIKIDFFTLKGISSKRQFNQYFQDLSATSFGRMHRAKMYSASLLDQDELDWFPHLTDQDKLQLAVKEYLSTADPNIEEKYETTHPSAYFKIAQLYDHVGDHKQAFLYHDMSFAQFTNKDSALYCAKYLVQVADRLKGPLKYEKLERAATYLESMLDKKYDLEEPTMLLIEILEKYNQADGAMQFQLETIHSHLAETKQHISSIHYLVKLCSENEGILSYATERADYFALMGANAGDEWSMNAVGVRFLLSSSITDENEDKILRILRLSKQKDAMDWVQKAMKKNYSPAFETYAIMLLDVYETLATNGEKTKLMKEIHSYIVKHAWSELGELLAEIKPRKKYSPEHYQLMRMVVNYMKTQDSLIAYNLGLDFKHGQNGAKRDDRLAFLWFEEAALGDHGPSIQEVAKCFEYGIGTPRNSVVAWDWFEIYHDVDNNEVIDC